MRFSFQLSTMLLCLLLCGSCNEEDELFVAKKNFESEVEQLQNLVFSFNKDVYPDTLLQCWDSSAYIEFTPKIRGQFKWNSSSELVFSPAEKLAPGTDYTARLTPQLTNKAKQRWPIRKEEIRFHTAPLRVTGSTISWTRGKAMSNTVVQIDFDFNYEVEVSEAATHIQLKSGDKTLSPFLTNGGRSRKVSLQFSPVNELDEETPLQATITKGIPVTATYTSSKDTQLNLLIPSRYNMTITGMSGHHNGAEGTILVYTSQPVAEEGLKSYVTIVPSVPFEITLSDMGFIITSNALKAEQQYEVTISKHLEGAFGGRMKRDHYEQIGFGKLEPAVNFLNSKGMYLSSAGFKNLALNIVNVPKVAVTVVKVYENNLEELFRRGIDYGYDWSEDDAQYYRYYNTHNLGDTVYQQTYETIKLPRNNSARVLHLDFKDRIRQYDGIYVISVASTEHNWVQESKILTLSDIGLIVKEDKHNTYVFANSIREASPIAGVQINFISSNNQR